LSIPIGTFGSVASLLAATLYQGNHDINYMYAQNQMIGNSINLNVSGNTKPKEQKQNRKTRMRYYMHEGVAITFDF
jgi:hypothetical protein